MRKQLIILVLLAVSPLLAKDIPQNSTDQSITVIILDADGDPNTSVTVTDLDLYIQRDGPGAQSAKVDLTALASADAAHTDYGAIHKGNGGVRVDIPDANLTDPVNTLINYYVVDGATSNKMAVYEVQITDPLERSDVNDYVNSRLDIIDGLIDAILLDTGTTIPAQISDGNDYLSNRADAILLDTGTTLPASLTNIYNDTQAILTDTGTTLPGLINDCNDVIIGDIASSALTADELWDDILSNNTTVGSAASYLRGAAAERRP